MGGMKEEKKEKKNCKILFIYITLICIARAKKRKKSSRRDGVLLSPHLLLLNSLSPIHPFPFQLHCYFLITCLLINLHENKSKQSVRKLHI